ncbi:MAG: hypothetical protein JEZ11_08375 [Desulfobacterales bacterium]|nr:hypothetical protein [Desulfobacterales bacterium]
MASGLCRPSSGRGETIALLFADDHQELARLLSIRDLLDDFRIVLVLPEYHKELVSLGHQLRPRFVGFAEGGLEDVAAVLQKMMKKHL